MDEKFLKALYSEESVPSVLDAYCGPILKSQDPLERLKAKRLLNYWGILTDKAFFDIRIQKVFSELYKKLNEDFPEISYELVGRIKGLISSINKVETIKENYLYQLKLDFLKEKYPNLSENELKGKFNNEELLNEFEVFKNNNLKDYNPFERVRDFFAFRITIEDGDQMQDYIQKVYDISNMMIELFNNQSFEIIESNPLIQIGELEVNSELIKIPEKSGLKPEYQVLCKDYVFQPKKDGYQSVHFVVFDPYSGRFFEVQIRTRSMDIISETLANHDLYKENRYGKQQDLIRNTIDYSKIHIKGFRYFKYIDPVTGESKEFISDRAGITTAIPIHLEIEHFLD